MSETKKPLWEEKRYTDFIKEFISLCEKYQITMHSYESINIINAKEILEEHDAIGINYRSLKHYIETEIS